MSWKISIAQEVYTPEKKEVECLLSVSGFQPITSSLSYKRQIKKQIFLKIGLINLNYSNSDRSIVNSTSKSTLVSMGAGFLGGIEFRKPLNQAFTFFHGPNIGFSYSYSKQIVPSSISNEWFVIAQRGTPQIVYSVGLLTKITEHFYFAVELNPAVSYSQEYINVKNSPGSNSLNTSFDINFGNKNATLSLVYKIH